MAHAINWFEIPATDINRALSFYKKILNANMEVFDMMGMESFFLPADMENGSIGGCVIQGEGYEPCHKGPLIYLNGGKDLNDILNRVETAGGKVMQSKTDIGDHGFYAFFEDSEGNKIGLHSNG